MGKKVNGNIVFLLLIPLMITFCPGCKKECVKNDHGILVVKHGRNYSKRAYKIKIDGVDMNVILNSNNSETYELTTGEHIVEFIFADNDSTACKADDLLIRTCKTIVFTCRKN